jgi:glycosyltransferase involved in cell wall biosynthesis
MIILLSPYLPAVDVGGCARQVYDFLRFARLRGYDVFLISFCSDSDRQKITALQPYCADLHVEYVENYDRFPPQAPGMSERIASLCSQGARHVLQCEASFMARYIPKEIRAASLLIEHEILSSFFIQQALFERDPVRKSVLWARSFKKFFECRVWYRRFNKIIVFSEADQVRLKRRYNLSNTEVIPLGIDLDNYPTVVRVDKCYDMIFVGSFSHAPNADAARYFCEKILPHVREKLPGVSVLFAGTDPPPELTRLAASDENITFTGYVPDVRAYYWKSRVFIAPLRYGTGACYKILEALAMQMPIVATPTAVRGFEVNGHIRIADQPREFADNVVDLLRNPDKSKALATHARQGIGPRHNWNNILGQYGNLYRTL